jgi:hypothetical protein
MSRAHMLVLAGATALVSCGTIEDNAAFHGIPRDDAIEVSQILRTEKHAHKIYTYERDPDGDILVQSDAGTYKVRRVRGKWVFIKTVILT